VSHVEGDVGTAGGEGGHAAGGDAVGELLKGRGCDGFGRFGFGIAVVDDVAAVAGRVVIALYEAGIDGWEVSGEGDGDGGAGKFAQQCHETVTGEVNKVVYEERGLVNMEQMT